MIAIKIEASARDVSRLLACGFWIGVAILTTFTLWTNRPGLGEAWNLLGFATPLMVLLPLLLAFGAWQMQSVALRIAFSILLLFALATALSAAAFVWQYHRYGWHMGFGGEAGDTLAGLLFGSSARQGSSAIGLLFALLATPLSLLGLAVQFGLRLPALRLPFRRRALGKAVKQPASAQARVNAALLASGLDARVVRVETGHVIDRYIVERQPTCRMGDLRNAADDLANALGRRSIRINAIEEANRVALEIDKREIPAVVLPDDLAAPSSMALPLAIGIDQRGTPVWDDLAAAPHVLVSGTTGSGKTTLITTILAQLVRTLSPQYLELAIVDPKRVGLVGFAEAPQLIAPIAYDSDAALELFDQSIAEMDRRYTEFAKAQAADISEYRAGGGVMPYRILVLEEFAGLMDANKAAIEKRVTRLAGMARAAGIHIVIATQRPSTDIVTGTIKANIPTVIGMRVISHHDSSVAIGQRGCENLRGRGDLLFGPRGAEMRRALAWFSGAADARRISAEAAERWGVRNAKPLRLVEPLPAVPDDGLSDDERLVIQLAQDAADSDGLKKSHTREALKCGMPRVNAILDHLVTIGMLVKRGENSQQRYFPAEVSAVA